MHLTAEGDFTQSVAHLPQWLHLKGSICHTYLPVDAFVAVTVANPTSDSPKVTLIPFWMKSLRLYELSFAIAPEINCFRQGALPELVTFSTLKIDSAFTAGSDLILADKNSYHACHSCEDGGPDKDIYELFPGHRF